MIHLTLPDGTLKTFSTKAEAHQFLTHYADNLEAESTFTKGGLKVGDHLITIHTDVTQTQTTV